MISIIDYGMGNLRSVQKAFEQCGFAAEITDEPKKIAAAKAVVLPGVGAFKRAMAELESRELVEPILQTIRRGKPFLGICLGLHLLFEESYEFGLTRGLGVIPGRVVRFETGLKVPHMGWNQVSFKQDIPFFRNVRSGSYFYFVHSYYVEPTDVAWVAATTDYGADFCSAVARDNVVATQFHPEKSQRLGLQLIKNFGESI